MIINEFMAKKLGEVLAFTRVGSDTVTKGRAALVEQLGEEKVLEMLEKNTRHAKEIEHLASTANVSGITLSKAEKTGQKLVAMRELYVGDQWDNAVELLEWSGFFQGAAIVHFALVRGCAEGINEDDIIAFAQECVDWHTELLELAQSELATVGSDRATL